MQHGINASGHQHQPADSDQPGDQAVAELPGVELAFKKVREPDQRLVHQSAVGQWPKLLKEQNSDKRKKIHAKSITAYREERRPRRKPGVARPPSTTSRRVGGPNGQRPGQGHDDPGGRPPDEILAVRHGEIVTQLPAIVLRMLLMIGAVHQK